jgi:5-methyltetrahydrofolate--homocysteine methyltransferase
VPPEDFIAAIRKHEPQIVGFSALLTTTMNMQWETLKQITKEGLRDKVKVFVGGAPISQAWCDKIGADAYGMDALVAVEKAKACVQRFRGMAGGDPKLHAAMLEIDRLREEAKLAATRVAAMAN